jgi:DNA end-binding protein Ku
MRDLAEHIIERKSGKFEPAKFEDRYEDAIVDMIKSKQAGQPVRTEDAPRPAGNIVSLMDALRRSIEAEKADMADETKKRAPSKPRAAREAPVAADAPKPRKKRA